MVSVDSKSVHGFRDPRWRLHILLDTELAFASVTSLKNYFMLVGALVLLLALGASFLFSKSIVVPVKSLLSGAQKLAHGNYNEPLPDAGKSDEIGQLTRSFNSMSVAIQKQQAELVKKTEIAENAVQVKSEFLANMSHCLLYTSPSPRDATLSRMPSSA